MPAISASTTWNLLEAHKNTLANTSLSSLFEKNPNRLAEFSCEAAGIFADFSKNLITEETLSLLLALANEVNLKQAISALLDGDTVNVTENRPALHTALRSHRAATAAQEAEVNKVIAQMSAFVGAVYSGQFRGFKGDAITDVVNVGIGGSDLGPVMVTGALGAYNSGVVRSHFVSNVDATDISLVLAELNPATTLFVIASKTFTTIETLTNAATAREWIMSWANDEAAIANHFVAVSTALDKVKAFGISTDNVFPMWDWVGGRYSLWSAIGLPIALAIGMDGFNQLRAGAAAMDTHFASAPLAENLPVLMGLIGVWYNNFWGAHSHAVLPYDHYLRLFPKYLQQLDMESNGKRALVNGGSVNYDTGAVIWGDAGTNGQHSFHQLLHQGSQFVPADFIAVVKSQHPVGNHQALLFANCLAQSRALMVGKTLAEAEAEFTAMGYSEKEAKSLAPHKVMPGNRPSTTLLLEELTPASLGSLIALYEHKVYVQSVVWGINAFDQWGVELGKKLSSEIDTIMRGEASIESVDASTANLIQRYLQLAKS